MSGAAVAAPGRLRPALSLMFNAFVWGVSWWPFRELQSLGLHPLWTTGLIYAMALAVIGVAAPGAWRELRGAPALWVVLLAAGTTNAAFNWAVAIGDVVRVVLLFYLMPLWAVLIARALLGERLTALAALRIALALAGAAVVLWPADAGAGLAASLGLPELLGLVGGFSFALNNVMLRREAARPESARALAMFGGGAAVAIALALALGPAHGVPAPPAPQVAWIAGAAALGVAFLASNLALQYGAARLPANVTAVVMLTEVVFASCSAVLAGAAQLGAQTLAGAALILAAAALSAFEPR